jgi:hypothetical protein
MTTDTPGAAKRQTRAVTGASLHDDARIVAILALLRDADSALSAYMIDECEDTFDELPEADGARELVLEAIDLLEGKPVVDHEDEAIRAADLLNECLSALNDARGFGYAHDSERRRSYDLAAKIERHLIEAGRAPPYLQHRHDYGRSLRQRKAETDGKSTRST